MKNLSVALYEPEIPQNVGAIMRICACFDVHLILIEPLGFIMTNSHYRRAKMDYVASYTKYSDFHEFMQNRSERKILFSPHSANSFKEFEFHENDILVFGRESNGVENFIAEQMNAILTIPMSSRCRSLNLSVSVAIAVSNLII